MISYVESPKDPDSHTSEATPPTQVQVRKVFQTPAPSQTVNGSVSGKTSELVSVAKAATTSTVMLHASASDAPRLATMHCIETLGAPNDT